MCKQANDAREHWGVGTEVRIVWYGSIQQNSENMVFDHTPQTLSIPLTLNMVFLITFFALQWVNDNSKLILFSKEPKKNILIQLFTSLYCQ